MKKVIILGATGGIGKEIVHFLANTDIELTLLARNISETLFPKIKNLSFTQADFFEYKQVGFIL